MKLTLILPNKERKEISVDQNITAADLKQMCAQEAFTSPSFTKIKCEGQALYGDKLAEEFGVHDGSVIEIIAAGL